MFRIFRKIRERVFTENKFSKYIFYSLGEIILVVIGILIALQVDNWNSERLNQQDLKKYAKSLVQDLQNDIHMLNVSRYQAKNSFHDIEQLRNYFSSTPAEKYSNTHLYVLVGNSLLYRPYKWNRSTLDEIKNSGYLRYIKNNILEEKLIAYETFSYHLDEDFEGDKDRSNLASEILSEMLDLNSPYFAQLDSVRKIHYKNPDFDIFQTEEFKRSVENDLELISHKKETLGKFLNTYILIQKEYDTRAFLEMPEIIKDAQELIELLKSEYKLNEE